MKISVERMIVWVVVFFSLIVAISATMSFSDVTPLEETVVTLLAMLASSFFVHSFIRYE